MRPGDVYVPHYYNTSWQPYYFTRDNLYQRVVNLNVPGAVTVVSVDEFTRGFDWRRARRADRNALASVNPVLDPLLVTPLRNAVVNSAWGRGKKDIPPGIARKLQDTTVITSTDVVAPAFRRDLARSMRVERVSDRAKGQQFKVRDERPVVEHRRRRMLRFRLNVVVRRQNAVMLQQSVVMLRLNAVVRQRSVGGRLNVAMLRLRLNVALVHQRIADRVHARHRARRHVSSRGTISVWQRHRPNVRHDRRSSDHRRNAYRDRFVSNDLRLVLPNDLRPDQRSELNGQRLRRELSGHGHSRANLRRSRTNRRRNHA